MTNLRRLIICASTISALAAMSAPAQSASTKYYSRQKLGALSSPTYTYVAAYGAYGACTSGSQTASITTCTRSDNTVVANSFCSPQTKSQDCTAACGTLTQYQGNSGGTAHLLASSVSSVSAAQAYCEPALAQYGAGVCRYNDPGSPSNGLKVYYFSGASLVGVGSSQPNSWGTTCK